MGGRLGRISVEGNTKLEWDQAISRIGDELDIDGVHEEAQREVDRLIGSGDHAGTLTRYKNKGLLAGDLAVVLGIQGSAILDWLRRLVSRPEGEPLRQALRSSLPVLSMPPSSVDNSGEDDVEEQQSSAEAGVSAPNST